MRTACASCAPGIPAFSCRSDYQVKREKRKKTQSPSNFQNRRRIALKRKKGFHFYGRVIIFMSHVSMILVSKGFFVKVASMRTELKTFTRGGPPLYLG
jgi:nitrate reductase gamma subunit